MSCEKDPVADSQVCKPENRPKIMDTGTGILDKRLKGSWKMEDIKEIGVKDFIDYQTLVDNSGEKPLINLKKENKGSVVSNLGNKCYGNFKIVFDKNKKWISVAKAPKNLFCTQIGGSPEMMEWESKYAQLLANTTCYRIANKLLTIQYFVNKNNKGKLIYEKVE